MLFELYDIRGANQWYQLLFLQYIDQFEIRDVQSARHRNIARRVLIKAFLRRSFLDVNIFFDYFIIVIIVFVDQFDYPLCQFDGFRVVLPQYRYFRIRII